MEAFAFAYTLRTILVQQVLGLLVKPENKNVHLNLILKSRSESGGAGEQNTEI
jgi:hypothetical protein